MWEPVNIFRIHSGNIECRKSVSWRKSLECTRNAKTTSVEIDVNPDVCVRLMFCRGVRSQDSSEPSEQSFTVFCIFLEFFVGILVLVLVIYGKHINEDNLKVMIDRRSRNFDTKHVSKGSMNHILGRATYSNLIIPSLPGVSSKIMSDTQVSRSWLKLNMYLSVYQAMLDKTIVE